MGEIDLAKWLIDFKIPFDGIDSYPKTSYDVHIDDSPAKLMSTKSTFKLLFTQPWNTRCLDILKCLKRVDNWQEVESWIASTSG